MCGPSLEGDHVKLAAGELALVGAKLMLHLLHRGLISMGRFIGRLLTFVLAAGVGSIPVFGLLVGSFVLPIYLAPDLGIFVDSMLSMILIGLFAWYVTPFVKPQITNAVMALVAEPDEAQVREEFRFGPPATPSSGKPPAEHGKR